MAPPSNDAASAPAEKATPGEWVVQIEGLECPFGSAPGLQNISLSIQRGESFFILGPSGAGKSTLLRAIAGLITPTGGKITIGDQVVNTPKIVVAPNQRGLQMVFQDLALWPHMKIKDQIVFAAGGKNRVEASWIEKIFKLTKSTDLSGRFPHELSGGEKQRAALARALAPKPQVLLLDEPMRHLDPVLAREMRDEMRDLFDELAITSIFVTHDQEEAFDLADRMLLLREGRIEAMGVPKELYDHPPTRYCVEFLGRSNLFTATVDQEGFVTTPLGRVCCDSSPGTEVAVRYRPEDLELSLSEGRWQISRGQLVAGRWLVELSDGSSRVLATPPPGSWDVGRSVDLRVCGTASFLTV